MKNIHKEYELNKGIYGQELMAFLSATADPNGLG